MAKEAKAVEEQVTKEAPPVRWLETVDSGWHISNEVFRRVAHTGEFSPGKEPVATPKKSAEHKTAPSAA